MRAMIAHTNRSRIWQCHNNKQMFASMLFDRTFFAKLLWHKMWVKQKQQWREKKNKQTNKTHFSYGSVVIDKAMDRRAARNVRPQRNQIAALNMQIGLSQTGINSFERKTRSAARHHKNVNVNWRKNCWRCEKVIKNIQTRARHQIHQWLFSLLIVSSSLDVSWVARFSEIVIVHAHIIWTGKSGIYFTHNLIAGWICDQHTWFFHILFSLSLSRCDDIIFLLDFINLHRSVLINWTNLMLS